MEHNREIGVSEARLGLSLLICLLLAIGYLLLHFLGGSAPMPPVELRPGLATQPAGSADETTAAGPPQPHVLPIENGDASGPPVRTSHRTAKPSFNEHGSSMADDLPPAAGAAGP